MRNALKLTALVAVLALAACDNTPVPSSSFEVATRGAQAAALNVDGSYAFIGSVQAGGSLWRVADAERIYDWNHKSGERSTINSAAFSADGRWAATATSHTIVLWNMADGKALRFWNAPAEVLDIALSPDANFALLGLVDSTAVIFDIKRGGVKRTLRHNNRVRSVNLSADGGLALTGSEDYSAILWDIATGQPRFTFQHDDEVQMTALSADGKRAMTASKYDRATVWDVNTGNALGDIPLAGSRIKRGLRFTAARFSNDGSQLLTGRPDQIVQLWDIATMSEIKRWALPKREGWKPTGATVLDVAFASDGYLAIAANGFVHRLK